MAAEENNLQRFIHAQEPDYKKALSEIKQGRKRSHWMWYIFPQIQGLGFSATSQFYAIKNLAEAEAYLEHPVLGSRLVEICQELLKLDSHDAHQIFGCPDDLKLKSSMTLFAAVANPNAVFALVLDKFFSGKKDPKTLELIDNNNKG
jgi:uncharacterized protein (DUF1810 family)